ncbi:hypothetical protein WJX72_001686 [[Myrmecia] bisecta]|uniref:Uncharacterized protein n=1 Tax=[Myrmecia] bisecta TaxID=41462 RepID=A0AAW1QPC8_9CHLO
MAQFPLGGSDQHTGGDRNADAGVCHRQAVCHPARSPETERASHHLNSELVWEESQHAATAQVLEMGIAFHSVLIGVAIGVSQSPCTIRPLLIALCFHQFFEGLALGGCLVQATFSAWSYALMAAVFALTTPVGVAIGIGVHSSYNENSPAALAVSGVFDAISTGILIYMALVDLIAVDFKSIKMRNNLKLELWCYVSLLGGAVLMSILAIWA